MEVLLATTTLAAADAPNVTVAGVAKLAPVIVHCCPGPPSDRYSAIH